MKKAVFDANPESHQRAWNRYRHFLAKYFLDSLDQFPANSTAPFVPWCGRRYWESPTKLMFVGKSVGTGKNEPTHWGTLLREWRNNAKRCDPAKVTDNYVDVQLRTLNPASHAFWTVPFLIAGALLPKRVEMVSLPEWIAWSNVYKFGQIVGSQRKYTVPKVPSCTSPSPRHRCLECISLRWLAAEIDILKPDVVFMGIGRDIWERISKFRRAASTSDEFPLPLNGYFGDIFPSRHRPGSTWLTYHFSAWRSECRHGRIILDTRRQLAGQEISNLP